ncbi:ABC transporter ATP-binding protein [bacterium]|nr:ABC transporter ATP-binding protein [bacterium]
MKNKQTIQQGDKPLAVFLSVVKRTGAVLKEIFHSFPLQSISVVFLTVITGFLPVVSLWISKLLLDSVVAYISAGGEIELLRQVLLMLGLQLGIGMTTLLLMEGNSYLAAKLSQLIAFDMEQKIYQHCLLIDYEFFEVPKQQDKLFRVQRQSAWASQGLFSTVVSITRKVVTIISSGIALFFFSPLLCLIAVSIAIPSFILNIKLSFTNYEIMKKRSERERKDDFLAYLLVRRNYVRDNLLFGTGNYFYDMWKGLRKKTLFEDLKIQFSRNKINGLAGFINQVANFGSYVYIVWVTAQKSGTIGSVVMNVGLFANAQGQIQGVADDFANLYKNALFLNDYYELKELNPGIERRDIGVSLDVNISSIKFEEVSFKYPESEKYALKDASFEIKLGECVCLVGENGAGKSTIIKLILRLYEPELGRILINDRDVRDYSLDELRKNFGVLMQDFSIYPFSVKENIFVGDINKMDDEAKLQESIDYAGLKEKVETLPKKENTILGRMFGKGEDLSIGEWQRLGLARVFFRNAPVIILDEPTSALDPKMESLILEHFRKMTAGKLSIIVSHRFSSARIADRIIVIDSGKVVETGTHSELIKEDGLYAQLFSIQKRRYVGDEEVNANERKS